MDFLYTIGRFLLFSLLSELVRPKMKRTAPAAGGLKDLSFPTVDPTRPHQWLIGRRIIDNANLFATWDFLAVARSKKVRTGIFSRERIPLPPVYYVSFGQILCGGSGVRLRRILLGDRVLWTGNAASGTSINVSAQWNEEGQEDYPRGLIATIDFHSGSTTPNAYVQSKLGAGNTPAWKHLTYVVVRGQAGGQLGAWIGTNKVVEHLKFECERIPVASEIGLGAHPDGVDYSAINGDANPAYAVAELMTNRLYGAGEPADTLNAAAFHAAAKRLFQEGHGTSQLWDSQRPTGDVILELCRQTGGVLTPEPFSGLQEFKLLRGDDTPLLTLDDSNVVRLDSFSRSAMSESTNTLALEYADKAESFKQRPVEVQDLAAIEAAGQVITGQAAYAGIVDANVAVQVAVRDLRALSAPLAAARLSAIVPKRQRLFPGDPVLFSSPANGVQQLRMRVTSSRYSQPGQALCELELIEDVFQSGSAVYAIPTPPTGGTGSGTTPLPGLITSSNTRLVLAPYGLAQDNADHAMFYAAAPDTTTTSYNLGLYETSSADPDFIDRPLNFAAFGTLATAIPDVISPGDVLVNITSASAATLRAFGSQPCYALLQQPLLGSASNIQPEWVRVSSITVNAAGTQATLTLSGRGLFDSVPASRLVGDDVHILCDYAVDPAPRLTRIYPNAGSNYTDPAIVEYAGLENINAVFYGRNVRGVGAGNTTGLSDVGAYTNVRGFSRAALPLPPGNVRIEGSTGSWQIADAPTLTISGSTFQVTWNPRQRTTSSETPWDATNTVSDSGVEVDVQLQRWTGSSWTVVESQIAVAPQTSVTLPKPAAGTYRVFLFPRAPVPNGDPTKKTFGISQAWCFKL